MVWGAGNYPVEFNPSVHGPYSPARFYGKPDTPLGEVKLGELSNWLGRRNYQPLAVVRGCSRGYWRWAQRWLLPKKPGVAGMAQFIALTSMVYYDLTYGFIKYHRHCKYH